MRIVLIGLTHPFRGGISHYSTLLCRSLRKRHEVRFLSLSRQYPKLLFPGKTQRDESSNSLGVENQSCIDSINPLSWFRTARIIGDYKPDLILLCWWHPFFAPAFGTIARRVRRKFGIPTCYLCHNAIPHESSIVDRMLLRYAYSGATAFIAHSKEDRDNLLQLRPGVPVQLNPHPTYDVFTAGSTPSGDEAKASLGIPAKKVLLFFGFIRPYKGLHYLIEAMNLLDPADGYHLLIVGEFYEGREKYREGLARLEKNGQLTLVDKYVPNEELPRYFAASDLVVAPYLSATQSGVIQIAYAFKRPVIATTVGGLPETVVDGRTGYLVPPASAQAIADSAHRYFTEADHALFQQDILKESRKYSWDRMVDTIEAVHADIAGP